MNRPVPALPKGRIPVPHARGDEPTIVDLYLEEETRSPRPWG